MARTQPRLQESPEANDEHAKASHFTASQSRTACCDSARTAQLPCYMMGAQAGCLNAMPQGPLTILGVTHNLPPADMDRLPGEHERRFPALQPFHRPPMTTICAELQFAANTAGAYRQRRKVQKESYCYCYVLLLLLVLSEVLLPLACLSVAIHLVSK